MLPGSPTATAGSFMTQSLHRLKPTGHPGRGKSGQDTNNQGAPANYDYVLWNDQGRQFAEIINRGRKKFEAGQAIHGVKKFVPISQGEHPQQKTGNNAGDANY